MLYTSGERRHPCLIPALKGKAFRLLPRGIITLTKLGREGNYLNLIKGIYEQPTASPNPHPNPNPHPHPNP